MPILVRNLPRTFTESELQDLFLPFGDVLACDLVMDQNSGKSKGFGFVELGDEAGTQKAIAVLNSSRVHDQKIRVKWSNQENFQTKQSDIQGSATDLNSEGSDSTSGENAWASARPKHSDNPGEYD